MAAVLLTVSACGGEPTGGPTVVTFSGSAVGAEADVLRRHLDAFTDENPDVRVEIRSTPDAADQRHQLYVQWLNARTPDPDILQLDVIWTAEFAAAGWILPLDRFRPPVEAFFPATIRADTWRDTLYAVPWFVDVGMLYWRTDLLDRAPATWAAVVEAAGRVTEEEVPWGLVWQGARYEGLVVTFLEHLHAFGGRALDADGRVRLDSDAALRALTFMRDAVHRHRIVPEAALTWREEQTRFAFQNGESLLMRNWPYAWPLMQDTAVSRVAGRFQVAPLPAGPGGVRASMLGGAQLAINAHSDEPEAAWRVVEFLTRPERMLARAREVGQYPARRDVYGRPELARALPVDPQRARRIIEDAVPRPVTPVYSQLSSILQIRLHRALTGQEDPETALEGAASEIRELLRRVGLGPAGESAPGTGRSGTGGRGDAEQDSGGGGPATDDRPVRLIPGGETTKRSGPAPRG